MIKYEKNDSMNSELILVSVIQGVAITSDL